MICPRTCLLLLLLVASKAAADTWRDMLDPELSQWETYLGVPHESVAIDWERHTLNGEKERPLGIGHDPLRVFSTKQVDDHTILCVTGQIYGVIGTLEEFSNYHFSLEVKWGNKTWAPRLEKPKDTGILYHGVGKHGARFNSWMESLECQIEVESFGDFCQVVRTAADVRVDYKGSERAIFNPQGELKSCVPGTFFDRSARRSVNAESPHGQWNTVEVYALRDKAIHVVNGKPVLLAENTRLIRGDRTLPLTSGKILLQSEGAEVFYRNIRIRSIDEFPADTAEAVGLSSKSTQHPNTVSDN